MILFLIGFMGSGKSWMGRRLAAHTGLPYHDLDQFLEAREGRTINDMFNTDGESYFRARERHWLEVLSRELSSAEVPAAFRVAGLDAIISTGGGTPCFSDAMDWMSLHGITVWLDPPFEVLLNRLERETSQRPVLEGKVGDDLRVLVKERMTQRVSFYGKARIRIGEPNPDPDDILKKIGYA